MDTEDILGLGSAVETIAQLGRDATALDVMTIIPPADAKGLVPFTAGFERRDGEMKSFAALAEEWRIHPARKRGTANVSTLASFIELVRRHQTDHSAIFASTSWPKLGLLAVIDYHEKDDGNPAFCQHKVSYAFPTTDEFKAWMDVDGKSMPQQAFAAFIEDRISEIASATPEEEVGVRSTVPDHVRDPRRHDDALARPGGECLLGREGAPHALLGREGNRLHRVARHQDQGAGPVHALGAGLPRRQSGQASGAAALSRVRRLDQLVLPDVPLEGIAARRDRQDVMRVTENTGLPAFEGTPEQGS
jgi:hypothetical protein